MLRMLYADDDVTKELLEAIQRAARDGGVQEAVEGLSEVETTSPREQILAKIDEAERLVERALRD